MKKTALVIMAAGIGSRFGKGIKQLEPVGPNGEIIMDYSIHDALEAGFNKVVFIIRKDLEKDFKEVIGNRISKITEVEYAFQELDDLPAGFAKPEGRTKPWGTGQAVLACKGLVKEPFAVINADDYYGKDPFVKLHDYLVQEHDVDEVMPISMAGFVLGNTLSDNGGVTRGVCVVDEKGNLVDGDAILYIYGKYMKERGKLENNTVVTTVMSNFGLYKAFDEAGIGYAKTAVGDKYVYEYMTKNGCILGGEQSGHIIFSKYASTGDGILTSLKMMEVMMARKKKMSELLDGLTIYPQVLENVRVTDKKAAQDDADVQAAVKAVTEALGDTGRILVRESGTEPLLRVMVEAETEEVCRKYVDQVVDVVKAKGHIAS